jgi:hypothetical protein
MTDLMFSTVGQIQQSTNTRLKSFTGGQWYSVSLDNQTCSCANFSMASRPCKHLNALGISSKATSFVARTHPTFSQALSGMVKSMRLRRVEDAVYWLVYLDAFKESQSRFRTARRILVGSAEDGHSISVMEHVVDSFRRISKVHSAVGDLATEVVRICKVPNWWHPSTGGHDYIYAGMVGHLQLAYLSATATAESLCGLLERGIAGQEKAIALAGVIGLSNLRMGGSKQAELVLALAKKNGHPGAERLANVHLKARSALSSDNNFLCQAVWMLAGGKRPVADVLHPVTSTEVSELIEKASARWKNPNLFPDGAVTACTQRATMSGSWGCGNT